MKRECLYSNNLKSCEFGKELAQILSGVSDIAREQGASEDQKFAAKLMLSKTNFSSCLGIFLTLLPLIAYANIDDYQNDLQEEAWKEEEQEYDEWIADQMQPSDDDMQSSDQMQQSGMQQQQNTQPAGMSRPFQTYVGQVGFFIGADYLYWTVKEGSTLEYTFVKDIFTYQASEISQPEMGLVGRSKHIDFDWNSGFRVNAGYEFGHDNWELLAEYTFFHTQGKRHTTRPDDNTLQGSFLVGQAPNVFPSAFFISGEVPERYSTRIRFHENVVDLKLRKHFAPTKYFGIGFSAGYEGAWLDQTWNMLVTATAPGSQMTKNKLSWKYVGCGPLIGVDLDWYFIKQFDFFLNAMGSILYGFHGSKIKTLTTQTIVPTFQNATSNDHRFVPHAGLQIGLSWDYLSKNFFFEIFAAYEINTWIQLQEARHDVNNSNNTVGIDLNYSVNQDPVTTHGLTTGVEFHF